MPKANAHSSHSCSANVEHNIEHLKLLKLVRELRLVRNTQSTWNWWRVQSGLLKLLYFFLLNNWYLQPQKIQIKSQSSKKKESVKYIVYETSHWFLVRTYISATDLCNSSKKRLTLLFILRIFSSFFSSPNYSDGVTCRHQYFFCFGFRSFQKWR